MRTEDNEAAAPIVEAEPSPSPLPPELKVLAPVIERAGTTPLGTSFAPDKLRATDAEQMYRDQGIVWVCPTRGVIPAAVVTSWMQLSWPMNQFRTHLIMAERMEVAAAYEYLVAGSMDKLMLIDGYGPKYGAAMDAAPFILTTEEDNPIPADAPTVLLRTIMSCPDCSKPVEGAEWCCPSGHHGYDAVSGLYFVKTDPPVPMAFGRPPASGQLRDLEFRPRSVLSAVENGSVIEVNGIAMGCALWRKALFKKVSRPWFRTTPTHTQDMFFCRKAKEELGLTQARFGVHCGVRVSHYDWVTGQYF
jgi:hypothetical protein